MRSATTVARLTVGLMLLSLGLLGQAAHAQATAPVVVQLRLTGVVDPLVADYVTGSVQRAQDDGAAAVLLEIDTPGGLGSSMREIDQALLNATIPVIGYVSPSGARAASAGAFILLSSPVAAMAPGTNVGASTPVGASGGDLSRKITNDAAASIRSIAQTYGRNTDVAETFVTQGASISAEEALTKGVIDLISPSSTQLLTELDGRTVTLGTGQAVTLHTADATIQEKNMGAFVGFLHALLDPNLAFIFFWLGLALIVLELIALGNISWTGVVLMLLAIVSFGLLPVRLVGLGLLVVSVVAFVFELKAPGLGVWGTIGVIALLLGGWFLYDRSGGVEVSPLVLIPVAVLVSLFFGVVVAKAMRMRKMPPPAGREAIVGTHGVTLPSGVGPRGGVVRVASEEWRAVAPAGAIPGGHKVRVTGLDGLVLTVEALDDEHVPAVESRPAVEGGNAP